MSKKYQYRIKKKAEGVYTIEERHTFMFLWKFWTKGSIRLKIPRQYASSELAETAIFKACAEKGIQPFIISMEGVKEALSKATKKARKKQRKQRRKAEEIAQNLRRIGKDPE